MVTSNLSCLLSCLDQTGEAVRPRGDGDLYRLTTKARLHSDGPCMRAGMTLHGQAMGCIKPSMR